MFARFPPHLFSHLPTTVDCKQSYLIPFNNDSRRFSRIEGRNKKRAERRAIERVERGNSSNRAEILKTILPEAFKKILPLVKTAEAVIETTTNGTDFALLQEKAKNCVLKNLPEASTIEETQVNDNKFISSVVPEGFCGLILRFNRHGEFSSGHRPLKLFTKNEKDKTR